MNQGNNIWTTMIGVELGVAGVILMHFGWLTIGATLFLTGGSTICMLLYSDALYAIERRERRRARRCRHK